MTSGEKNSWLTGRVLLVGDSRANYLKSTPSPHWNTRVDYAYQNGAQLDDLITLIDAHLTLEHQVLVVLGLLCDETRLYSFPLPGGHAITLVRSRESKPVPSMLTTLEIAHKKWRTAYPQLLIIWTIPYYIDLYGHNMNLLDGVTERADTTAVSYDASFRFVTYIAQLKTQWMSKLPSIPFLSLNGTLFCSHGVHLLSSFAGNPEEYKFPPNQLLDGVHPSPAMTERIWSLLEATASLICRQRNPPVHPLIRAPEAAVTVSNEDPFIPMPVPPLAEKTTYKHTGQGKKSWRSRKTFYSRNRGSASHCPAAGPRNSQQKRTYVHEKRLPYNTGKPIQITAGQRYGNLSWRAKPIGEAAASSPSTSGSRGPLIPQSNWHRYQRELLEAQTENQICSAREQIEAEAEVATILRQRGIATLRAGYVPFANQISDRWLDATVARLNQPPVTAVTAHIDLANLVEPDL
ncbi:unnamed protein product [Rotaria socialis]|uniref:Uncharacterized protein n=1 Tax=Rotaria socialis TaxID=392032 RepID=A0A821TNJ0_9BILA|nr:unnamed protein product [Rotaria socialis]CAF4874321.1 unnamed protein product [Rotaria socialis]